MPRRQIGIVRAGLAMALGVAAALLILFLLPTPKPGAAAAAAGTSPTADGDCLAVPHDFGEPQVAATAPPPAIWKGWTYGTGIQLAATPIAALVDHAVTIRVTGLQPGAPVTLRASTTGYQKHAWMAQATFMADARGAVEVANMAPKYGDYSGVHAMGLVWSMRPQGVKHPGAVMCGPASQHVAVKLEALAAGRTLATTTLTREFAGPGVKRSAVSAGGLAGELYTPATPGPHPAVIVLGGSEGGLYPQVNEAALLASHGYVAMGLAYFQGYAAKDPRLAGLPKQLVNIPLEYFARAAAWLRAQPGVTGRPVAIMGWSKGAEAALLAAAEFPRDFQAVVAIMPSSVVWQGLAFDAAPSSSWTLGGKPLPWLSFHADPSAFRTGEPVAFLHTYRRALDDTAAAKRAAIPVERIAGPVLLISGSDDQVWPSPQMAGRIMRRLAAHHRAYRDQSLCYAGAGHAILPPWRPANANAAGIIALGGSPDAYAFADGEAWNHVLAFLHDSLDLAPARASR